MNPSIALFSVFSVSAIVLSACARTTVAVGGEIGGVVSLVGISQDQALKSAQDHCSKYGTSARMVSVRPEEGGKFVFECVKPAQ
jgi:hypothetical protein